MKSDKEILKPKGKRGIIYLSTIPKYMNVAKLREMMLEFGEVGRIFLQPSKKHKTKKKSASQFTEGWVEFIKKRVAKQVALMLNNQQIGGRKKSKFYDCIWNIKYLPRFKWVHLSERLAYEKAVHKQRMRAEISQVRKEADIFAARVQKSEKIRKLEKTQKNNENSDDSDSSELPYEQRKTEKEIVISKKAGKKSHHPNLNVEDRSEFLKSLLV